MNHIQQEIGQLRSLAALHLRHIVLYVLRLSGLLLVANPS